MNVKPVTARIVFAFLVLAAVFAAPGWSATSQFEILVNRDLGIGTGCDYTPTPPGSPQAARGLEQILTATVTTGPGTATVTSITQRACVNAATDTFGPPVAIAGATGAVGQDNGVDGFDVVELCVPYATVATGAQNRVRLGLISSNLTGSTDVVSTPAGNGNQPIFLELQFTPPIPTLSEWGLILMALLLAAAAAVRLRKRRMVAGGLMLLAILGVAGVAWAVVTDGLINDWHPTNDQLALDPIGDALLGADVRALFGKTENAQACFRIDAALDIPPPNQAPVADDDAYNVDEGGTLNVPAPGVLDGDTDPEGDPLTAVLVTGPAHGTLTLNADGSFTYTHDGSETPTTDTFTYRANDGIQNSNVATVTITINPVNDAPVADDDAFSVAEGGTLNVPAPGVLDGDTDPDGDPLTAVLDSGPAHGTLTLNPDGSFTYTHDGSETPPTDTFTYHATDGTANSNVATVTITILAENDAPVADDDAYSVDEGGTLNVPTPGVLDGDTDAEGSALTAVLVTGPAHGTLTLNADGSFTYTHDGSETPATDTFTYQANDGTANSNVATVTITINPVNDAPVADDDAYSVAEGGTLNVPAPGVLDGDTDADGDPLTAVLDSGPAHGTLTLNPDGSFTYTHDGSETPATDSFTYHANDGTANSNVATVTITIIGENDAPVAVDDSYNVGEGGTLNEPAPGVLANDLDAEGNPLTAVLDSGPAHGTLTLNPDGSFTYTHDGSETPPTDTFTYHANDGAANSNVATVTITITAANDAPVLDLDADDSGGTPGSDYAITFADGDPARFIEDPADATITDADSATLTTLTVTLTNLLDPGFEVLDVDLTGADPAFSKDYDTTTDPNQGVLTITASPARPVAELVALLRKVTYVNTDDDLDTTSRIIQFVANDGTDDSNTATTTVTMTAVNDAPVADDDAYSVDEGGTLTVPAPGVLDGDTDPENDSLTAVLDSGPAHGTLTLNADGSFTYTHDGSNTPLTDTFTYHANDGTANSNVATVTITINPVNDAPVADDDAYSVDEGGTLTVPAPGVLDGDTDPDGDTLTAVLNAGPSHGTLTLNPDGSFTYTHDGSETPSTDSFTYHANDGTVDSNIATVTITIDAVNDAPVADDDAYSVDEGGTLTQPAPGVLDGDTDPEGSTLTAVLDSGPAHGTLTLNPDGSFTYTHDGSETPLTDSFTYHANDGTANSNIATVTITINPVNDAPVADNDAYAVDEGGTLTVPAPGVLDGDTDAEGDSLTAVLDSGPANGTLMLNADGSFTYTHDGSETLIDSFTYHANDGAANSTIATVTITVNPVNDPPVANDDTASITEEAPNVPAANTVSGNVLTNDTDPDSTLTVSAVAGGTVGSPRAGSFGSLIINSNGSYTYTLDDANPTVNALKPGQMLMDAFDYTASDGSLADSATLTVTIHGADDPATPDDDAFDFIGNTELRVDLAAGATPAALETTPSTFGVIDGDIDPEGDPITISGIVGCADISAPFDCVLPGQGTVSLQANGRFTFVPEPGDLDPTASFQYTLAGNPAPATVTLTRFERVWYVKNDAPAGGLGRSSDPFDTLVEAQTASQPNDYIFVYFGTGTTTGHTAGIALKNGQHLIGHHAGLSLPVNLNGNGAPTNLVDAAPGNRPMIDDTVVDAIEGVSAVNVIPAEIVGLNLAGNVNAIDWNTTAAFAGTGAFSIRDNVIRSAASDGVDINLAGTGATSLAFHDNVLTATGAGLDIQETGTGSLTITRFENNVVSGNTAGTGININTATFDATPGGAINPVSGGVTVIGAPGNGVGGSGLVIAGMTGTLAFTDLDIFADAGAGLRVGGTGVATTNLSVGAGVATVQATGGPAVDLTSLTTDLQLTSLTSTNSASTGVALTTVNGTFSAGSGSAITNATGTDFAISGGTANVTYGGTITDDVGQLVSISGATAGTKSFTGAITDGNDGDGSGISLTGNTGATISFSGGLTLSTGANPAFSATGGGTLRVTGSTNTIATTTGIALNVANTTIHADDLTFRSISSNGAASGIILNNTGGLGGLTVSGTGGAGTGGTIQNTTSHAISLVNARDVVLNSMNILDPADSGVFGDELTNFTINNSLINGAGDTTIGDEAGLQFEELLGNCAITNTTVSNSFEDNIRMLPSSGVLTNLAITGSTIGPNPVGTGANGLTIVGDGTANVTLTITGTTFTGNQATGFLTSFTDTARHDITITNSTFTGNNIGIQLSNSLSSDMNFNVSNNTFLNHANHAILIVPGSTATNAAEVVGTIANNIIGNGTVDSGSRDGHGIRLDMRGDVDATVAITGNTIRNTDVEGIFVESRLDDDADAEVGHLDLTLRNNNSGRPDDNSAFPFGAVYGTRVEARNSTVLCLDIAANDAENVGSFEDIRLRQRDTSTFRLERFVGNGAVDTDVEVFVTGQNPLIDNADATHATSFTGVANGFCAKP